MDGCIHSWVFDDGKSCSPARHPTVLQMRCMHGWFCGLRIFEKKLEPGVETHDMQCHRQ